MVTMATRVMDDDPIGEHQQQLLTPPVFTPSILDQSLGNEEEERESNLSSEEEEIPRNRRLLQRAILQPPQGFDIDDFTRKHLYCPRCGQYYNDPRTLPCLDTYCKVCLEEIARQKRAEAQQQQEEEEREEEEQSDDVGYFESLRSFNITPCSSYGGGGEGEESDTASLKDKYIDINNFYCPCPQGCQATTGIKVEENGHVLDLPNVNLFLKNLVDTIRLKEELPAGQTLCHNCDVRGAMAIAVCNNEDCANKPLCADCLAFHVRSTKTKEHRIVYPSSKLARVHGSRGDGSQGNSSRDDDSNDGHGDDNHGNDDPPTDWKNFNRCSWRCHKHPKYVVDRYCPDHRETICMCCQLIAQFNGGHLACLNVHKTETFMAEEIQPLNDLLERVSELHEEFKVAIDNIKTMKVALAKDKDWIMNAITERCNNLVESLEQQRIGLTRQTTELFNSKLVVLDKQQKRLETISQTFTRSEEFIRGSLQIAIPTEFMSLKEIFHKRLNFLLNHYARQYRLPSDSNNQVYLKLNDVLDIEDAIGQVSGTPFIQEFTLEKFPAPLKARKSYRFEIKCRDICRAPLLGVTLPHLRATISKDDEEPIDCYVRPDREQGTYSVYMFPAAPGAYTIAVFNSQEAPLEDIFIKGFPVTVIVQP